MDSPDFTRRLVVAKSFRDRLLHTAGTPVSLTDAPLLESGSMTEETAGLMFARGHIVYADRFNPTPIETPEQEAARVVTIGQEGDKFVVRAPWTAPEEFDDLDVANSRRVALVAAGRPNAGEPIVGPQDPLTDPAPDYRVEETGSNGYFTVFGPGLPEEGERVRGKTKAEERAAELRLAAQTPADPPITD